MSSVMIIPTALSRYGTRSTVARTMTVQNLDGPSSSPLSMLGNTPTECSEKKKDSDSSTSKTNGEDEPRKGPKITLRLNRILRQAETTLDGKNGQSALKRKRADSAVRNPRKNPKQDVPGPKATEARPQIRRCAESSPKNSKAKTARPNFNSITKATNTKKSALINQVKKSPVYVTFSETAIAGFGLREIYQAIPSLPPHQLQKGWVPLEIRQESFELVERFVNYQSSAGKDYKKQLQAVRLDLNLWDDDLPQVCKVRYPQFERVMEKILFWIDRGKPYRIEPASAAKHKEAKAVKAVREQNMMSEEGLFHESEIKAVISELRSLEHDPMITNGDSTLHRLRSGIFNVATRFCIEQSRVGLDCGKIIKHLEADLHLCSGDFGLMKGGKLPTLSRQEILAITHKLPAWFQGKDLYAAGKRAVQMYEDSWYEDYATVHREMTALGMHT